MKRDVAGLDARHLLDRRRKRATMAEADNGVVAAFDLAPQEARAGETERAQRQALLAEIGSDFAQVETIAGAQRVLEDGAFDDPAVDGHLHDAVRHGTRYEPMRLHGGQSETLGDGRLRQPADIVQPRRSDRERLFRIQFHSPWAPCFVQFLGRRSTGRPGCETLAALPCTVSAPGSRCAGPHTAVDMRRPEGNAFGDLRHHLPVVRFAFLEAQFEADLIVLRPALGKCLQQRFGMNSALRVELGREGPVAALVHQALLDVDDRRHLWHRPRPGIGVVIVRIGGGHVAMVDVGHHPHRHAPCRRRQPVLQLHAFGDRLAEFAADAHRLPEHERQSRALACSPTSAQQSMAMRIRSSRRAGSSKSL